MFTKILMKSFIAATMTFFVGSIVQALTIDTVPVGDPGNDADTRYSYLYHDIPFGAVNYSYDIGKFEVTAGQYCEFLNAVAQTDNYGLYNTSMWSDSQGCKIQRSNSSGYYSYSVAPDYANRPVNYVSWGDAARFCNWMNNGTTEDGSYYLNGATTDAELMAVTRKDNATWVIPTEDEWYKAAYYDPNKSGGAGYWDYPTATNQTPGRDMNEQTKPGNNANFNGSPYPIDSGTYYTTDAGEFELSVSPYGTFDQGGNVFECNETAVSSAARCLRGGSFNYNSSTLAASDRYNNYPTDEYGFLGFRVAEVPEPATLPLLIIALTCFSGFAWRRLIFAKPLGE